MKVTNENNSDTPLLTNGDLAIAAYAIQQCFNAYLESYQSGDFEEEMSKEEMQSSMNQLQMAFIKFDSLVKVLNEQNNAADAASSEVTDGDVSKDTTPAE